MGGGIESSCVGRVRMVRMAPAHGTNNINSDKC